MTRRTRPPADIRREITDVERHLDEMPPHSGSTQDLHETLARLRRELREAERERAGSG